jgi:rRNA maturation endonuclease Nob1
MIGRGRLTVNLKRSRLCLDCDEIFDEDLMTCPKCGSRAFWPTEKFLKAVNWESELWAVKRKSEVLNEV